MKHPAHVLLLAGFGTLLALAASCGSGESSSPNGTRATEPAPTGTLTGAQGWPRVEGLRGGRYCEVLLARIVEGRLNGDVWNTYGLNDCPPDAWAALDAEAIKAEHGVIAALLNGPRYWLMDAIERRPAGERRETTFGTIEMFLAATVDIGPIPPNLAPYTERKVSRGAVFEFSAGAEVYELADPAGRVFVMQSYSTQHEPTLTEDGLAALGSHITPPDGWTYRARVLETELRVEGESIVATVIQDELGNTYSLIESD